MPKQGGCGGSERLRITRRQGSPAPRSPTGIWYSYRSLHGKKRAPITPIINAAHPVGVLLRFVFVMDRSSGRPTRLTRLRGLGAIRWGLLSGDLPERAYGLPRPSTRSATCFM